MDLEIDEMEERIPPPRAPDAPPPVAELEIDDMDERTPSHPPPSSAPPPPPPSASVSASHTSPAAIELELDGMDERVVATAAAAPTTAAAADDADQTAAPTTAPTDRKGAMRKAFVTTRQPPARRMGDGYSALSWRRSSMAFRTHRITLFSRPITLNGRR